jgi:DNA-binding protein WhiA
MQKKWIMEQLFNVDYEKKILSFDENTLRKVCCQRSFLRVNYICRGFINRPEDNYHLELLFNDKEVASKFQNVLSNFGIYTRKIRRKNKWIVYIKDSDKISDLLRIIGANQALLNFENIRIIKSVRNQVNRHVNCETANLAKTVNASLRQIELINMFIERYGVEKIPPKYRQLALLRLESPDKSLQELGANLNPPLSKSGVAYRMRRIEEIARESLGQN